MYDNVSCRTYVIATYIPLAFIVFLCVLVVRVSEESGFLRNLVIIDHVPFLRNRVRDTFTIFYVLSFLHNCIVMTKIVKVYPK